MQKSRFQGRILGYFLKFPSGIKCLKRKIGWNLHLHACADEPNILSPSAHIFKTERSTSFQISIGWIKNS